MGRHTVLFFLSNLRTGGAQRTIINLLRHIDRAMFECRLALFDYDSKESYVQLVPADCPVIDLGISRSRFAVKKIIGLLNEVKPDTVFSTSHQVNAAVALAHLVSRSKSRLVLRETNYARIGVNTTWLKYQMRRFAYGRSHAAVALSQGVADEMCTHYKLPGRKIAVIYNPIDLEQIRKLSSLDITNTFDRNRFNIVTCGRLVQQKNTGLLIKALALSRENSKEWGLYILGDGPEEAALKQLAAKLGVHGAVKFLGFQENPYSYMARADLFVLPSLWEGFGHVLVEAMASGTPVLATDCPHGPRETLGDGRYGWLVPNDDCRALAGKIEYLEKNRDELVRMRETALRRSKDFAVERIVKEYEQVLAGE